MRAIQALILAGGVGKRMWPLSLDKNLIPFLGQPIIEYSIDEIIKAEIKRIIIVTNLINTEPIKEIVKKKSTTIRTVVQPKPKGMADALLMTKPLIKDAPFVVVNASDLYNRDVYKKFIQGIKGQEIVLGGIKVSSYLYGGYFKLKGKRVIGLIEKPGQGNEPSNFFKTVVDYFRRPKILFSYLSRACSKKDDLYEVALDMMIKNEKVDVFKIKSFYQQIKYPWHILDMMEAIFNHWMKNKISKDSRISPRATIKEPVVIERGVKILEGAVIKGPVYLGKNTVVGNNVLIRDSMIGENCVIGYNTEIARSWIGGNSWFHCNYIGDSVIEGRVNFGSGARIANLRLDEKEVFVKSNSEKIGTGRMKFGAIIGKKVKVGINASIMPGTLVDKNLFIGPGVVLK